MHIETKHPLESYSEDQLIEGLEPDQLTAVASKPLSRLVLNRPLQVVLWGIRVFVLVTAGLVVYTFIVQTIRGAEANDRLSKPHATRNGSRVTERPSSHARQQLPPTHPPA